MTEAEFVDGFRRSYRAFWLIAHGVVRDRELAEDVLQEAAIAALSKRDRFRKGTNFQAWIGQFVRHIAMNRARRERRSRSNSVDPARLEHRRIENDGDSGAGTETTGERTPTAKFDARLLKALDDVGDVARTCLLLRAIEGLEYARIAELLEIPEGTAMSHVHRTRKFLRERLSSCMDLIEDNRT